jgi:hypothetical protein
MLVSRVLWFLKCVLRFMLMFTLPPSDSCHLRSLRLAASSRLFFYILPQYWQWPGDVEALVVDLTHRVCVHASIFSSSPVTFCRSFFVEIFNFDPTAPNSPHFLSPKAEYPAEFRISACVRAVNNYAII